MPYNSTTGRLYGRIGSHKRWSRTSPTDRKAQMAHVREGQHRRYLDKALALPGGDTMTTAELEKRARSLQLADLAEARVLAYKATQAAKAPKGSTIVPLVCSHCGKDFAAKIATPRPGDFGRYCSHTCRTLAYDARKAAAK